MTDTLLSLVLHLAQVFGGSLGWAILALSLGIRVALFPLTLRLSRRMLRNQEIARAMQPELDELKKRLAKKPEKLFAEMQAVYRKHGYKPFDLPAMAGSFLQLPIFAVLYSAIRQAVVGSGPFLWIRTLASPDAILTLTILALTGASAYFLPSMSDQAKSTLIFIQVAVTTLIVWKLAAGLSLYWIASSTVGLLQNLWIRRGLQRNGAVG